MSIRLEHVSYAYEDNSSKKNYALKDVNLEIKKEEFIAVIGHTGSGKSTLMKCIMGFSNIDSGEIWIFDSLNNKKAYSNFISSFLFLFSL